MPLFLEMASKLLVLCIQVIIEFVAIMLDP